jgi:hypothetical protein
LGTRFLSSNGLGFADFWSRTDHFKIPKDNFSLNGLYFQEEPAIIFVFIAFQVTFSLNMSLPDSLLKSLRGAAFLVIKLRPTKSDLIVSKLSRAFKMLIRNNFASFDF